ncbi:MAG: hypothetical protein HKN76_20745 [Saprospiraceae bacterium]|nr:hypothetical protein [Saprospiraceae bacterium]
MQSPNDHIIESVFQAMLEHLGPESPESRFYHSMKDANIPLDNRMLANFIIQDFPWPVGVELRRLFSGDLKDRDKNRIDQILRAGEKLAQFFAFCSLVQLWDESKVKEIPLSKDFQHQIENFDRPTFGVYTGLLRAAVNLFEKQAIVPFIDLGSNQKSGKLINDFNQMVTMRNEDRHHGSEMDCQEGEELLKELLIQLSCITKYKLASIREIKVLGPKLRKVQFQHSIRMLNSQHEDFTSIERGYDEFSNSHAVLLMKDFTNPKEYLNLSPLVVDTSTLLDKGKVPGIKNGIYMFQQLRNDKYVYALTNASEQAAFNELPNFEFLQEQFDDLRITLMGGPIPATA